MKPNKFLKTGVIATLSATITLSGTNIALATPLNNDENNNEQSETILSLETKATITVITNEATEKISIDQSKTFREALAERGYDASNYRLSNDLPINPEETIANRDYVIFKNDVTTDVEIITLKPKTIKKETDELLIGEKKVEQKGKKGKALKTIIDVKSTTGDKESISTEEKLTIIETPEPRIVLIGTKEPEPDPVELVASQLIESRYQPSNGMSRGGEVGRNEIASIKTDSKIVQDIIDQVGMPYVWGAAGPNAFDCSGLVYWAYAKNAGYTMPRTAKAIGMYSTPISYNELEPGDVLWIDTHIAVYVGGGKVVHAFNPRVGVVVDNLSYFTSNGYRAGRLSK